MERIMPLESHHWIVLAKDRSQPARGRLLIDLAHEILVPGTMAATEQELFFDIVRRLLPCLSLADRRVFADVAADCVSFPRDLLNGLAADDIVVAEPVLRRAIGLRDDDLADLAGRLGIDHRAAIATRAVVSARIVRILMRRGGREVMHRLCANQGAEIGEDSLRDLRLRAEHDDGLLGILRARGDDRRDPRRHGEPVRLPEPAATRPAAAAPARPLVDALVERIHSGSDTLEAIVVELADADRHADLACLIGRLARIDEAGVMRVLVRADGAGVATLAGGLALDDEAFDRVVELRRRKLRFSASQARWEREAYRKLDRSEARSTLGALGNRRRVVA